MVRLTHAVELTRRGERRFGGGAVKNFNLQIAFDTKFSSETGKVTLMSELKSVANRNPEPGLDQETRERISIVVCSRIEDPVAAGQIQRAVHLRLNTADWHAIHHRDTYIAMAVDRAIFDWVRREARARSPCEINDSREYEGMLSGLKGVARGLSQLSVVVSTAAGTCLWALRLIDPIRRQFPGAFFGSTSLELLLVAGVSIVAVLIGGALGILAVRHGAGK